MNPKTDFALLYQTDQSKINWIMVYIKGTEDFLAQSGFFDSFDTSWSEWSYNYLFSKETQNPFSDSFGFKNPIFDFITEMHP